MADENETMQGVEKNVMDKSATKVNKLTSVFYVNTFSFMINCFRTLSTSHIWKCGINKKGMRKLYYTIFEPLSMSHWASIYELSMNCQKRNTSKTSWSHYKNKTTVIVSYLLLKLKRIAESTLSTMKEKAFRLPNKVIEQKPHSERGHYRGNLLLKHPMN